MAMPAEHQPFFQQIFLMQIPEVGSYGAAAETPKKQTVDQIVGGVTRTQHDIMKRTQCITCKLPSPKFPAGIGTSGGCGNGGGWGYC